MPITNNYSGFTVEDLGTGFNDNNKDSDFGENLNRNIASINLGAGLSSVVNQYTANHKNMFGSSSNYTGNEQRMIQSMITESININGITVRYMPRKSEYNDEIWNEQPEAVFERGLKMDMLLVSTQGFEGEGEVMSQYGIEFREEVILSMSIGRFDQLYASYTGVDRNRPLEGDLIVIPFGRTSQNRNQYLPKVFEILRVTTYQDGAFFQMGDNYQYKIYARLFELSGESLEFQPNVTKVSINGDSEIVSGDSDDKITLAREGITLDQTGYVNTVDSEFHADSFADNESLERESQTQVVYDRNGQELQDKEKILISDYTAKAFGYDDIINDLDDI